MLNDFGYIDKAIANIKEVAEKQESNIKAAAKLMADAIVSCIPCGRSRRGRTDCPFSLPSQ